MNRISTDKTNKKLNITGKMLNDVQNFELYFYDKRFPASQAKSTPAAQAKVLYKRSPF